MGHYPNTALFNPPSFFFSCRGSGLSSLRRLILKKQGLMHHGVQWFFRIFAKTRQIFPTGCSMIFEGLPCAVDRSWCAQRCCDGAATESLLRRRRADQLRRAHSRYSARRVRDGADAARSAAAAELRRSRCCDGAAQTSSVALILRVASRRDALNEEPASFSPALI